MVDLTSLSLYPATQEQVIESRKRSFAEWGQKLPLEEYLERDAYMDGLAHAKNNRLTTCFLRKGIIAAPDSSAVSEVSCYGIASVFTPAHKRGKGYARQMMRLLHWVMAPRNALPKFPEAWGSPPDATGNADFSVLYSDVGSEFYHQCGPSDVKGNGWLSVGSIGTIWNAASPGLAQDPEKELYEWELLDKDDLEKVWRADTAAMREDLLGASKSSGRPCFAFLPTEGVAAFQVHRKATFSPGRPPVPALDHWGVVLAGTKGEPKTFATWTIDDSNPEKTPTFLVTRLRATANTLPSLMRRIRRAIEESVQKPTATRIEVWNLPVELQLVASQLGGITGARGEHLPSFKWYGKEQEPQWLFNEK
ncbi:hypothetical protein HWV62_21526 [Athelia sp. TMB]|nr:hypothetical protein HWV62_21526 [Athelia sp. TMB]